MVWELTVGNLLIGIFHAYFLTGWSYKQYAKLPGFIRILGIVWILLFTGMFLSLAVLGAFALLVSGGIIVFVSPRPDFWSIVKACSSLGYAAAIVLIAYRVVRLSKKV